MMIGRLIFRLGSLAAILAVALMPATPALANYNVTYETDYIWEPYPLGVCDDGSILIEDIVIHETGTWHFDNDGLPIKLGVHLKGYGRVYLQDSPENFLIETGNWNGTLYDYDRVNDVFLFKAYSGFTAKIVVPGYGNILQDTGKMIFEWDLENNTWGPMIFESGHHEWGLGEFGALCSYLTQLP